MSFLDSQLFKDVQLEEVFADSKMFADAIPNLSWQSACELYPLTRIFFSFFCYESWILQVCLYCF